MRLPIVEGASSVIVVPTFNEEDNIVGCIESLLRGSLPCPIIVADGGSSDATRTLVAELAAKEPTVALVDNPGRTQARALNMVAQILPSDCKWLIRADAHSVYPKDFAGVLVKARLQNNAGSVVVKMRAVGNSCFGRAAACAQNSVLGNGGALHRSTGTTGKFVDHGHHALFDVRNFRAVGGYDETFSHNEDFELDHRMRKAGGAVWLTAETQIDYTPRSTPWALAKQYYSHGRGRARTTLKHRIVPKIRQMLPLAIFACYLFGIALSPLSRAALAVPAAHLMLCSLWGALLSWRDRDICALASGPVAVIMHLSWATGFISQLLTHLRRARRHYLAPLANETATQERLAPNLPS